MSCQCAVPLVSAGTTGVVVLRGLTIRGQGATVGIQFNSGRLRVERCTVSGFVSSPDGFPSRDRGQWTRIDGAGFRTARQRQRHLLQWLARSVVSLNDIGLKTLNAGIIYTAGDNAVLGNFETNIGPGTVFFASDITS